MAKRKRTNTDDLIQELIAQNKDHRILLALA